MEERKGCDLDSVIKCDSRETFWGELNTSKPSAHLILTLFAWRPLAKLQIRPFIDRFADVPLFKRKMSDGKDVVVLPRLRQAANHPACQKLENDIKSFNVVQ